VTKDFDKALEVYALVREKDDKRFEAFYNSGNIFLERNDATKAAEMFKRASELSPEDPFVWNNYGIALEKLKQDDAASQAFVKAVTLRASSGAFNRNAGAALVRSRKYPQAIPYLEAAVTSLPDDQDVKQALAEAYAKESRFADADRILTPLAAAHDKDHFYWYNLGFVRHQQGNLKGAKEALRKAMQLNDRDIDTLNNYGMVQFKEGDYAGAQITFTKLVGIDPRSLIFRQNLGTAAASNQDYAVAVTNWREVLKANPKNTQLRLEIANAQWEMGSFEDALANFKVVVSQDKKNANALNGIGLYHMNQLNYAQAEAAFRSSVEADPKFVPAYLNLAFTLDRAKQRAKAIAVLETALKIAPGDAEVKKALARMRN
jgi:tetratricopeptide (TPR) repeat protein